VMNSMVPKLIPSSNNRYTQKSARLAYEQAERLGAYVGEAVFEHRRRAIPVSTLLTPGGL
jgi:hypothetical protein